MIVRNKNSILSSSNRIRVFYGGFSVNVDLTGFSNHDTNAILKAAYDLISLDSFPNIRYVPCAVQGARFLKKTVKTANRLIFQ